MFDIQIKKEHRREKINIICLFCNLPHTILQSVWNKKIYNTI